MARERSPNRDKAKEMYLFAKGEIKLTDIAAHLKVSDSQIRKWKSTDKWDLELNGALPKGNSNVTNKKGAKKQRTTEKKEPIAREVEEVIGNDDLTDKQRLFCIYCVEYLNATKAYQKAYGCSYRVANVNGSRLLVKASVKSEVERLKAEVIQGELLDMKLIAKKVFQKYIDIAFADINDYLEVEIKERERDDGTVIRWNNVIVHEEFDGSIVTEISQGKDGIKVKLADKMRALEFLAKHTGLLSADVVQKLEMEREKLAIMKRKEAPEDEEVEDDGFIAALSNHVEEVWDDEEES